MRTWAPTLLALLTGLALAGCNADGKSSPLPPFFPPSATPLRIDPGIVQRDVMNFADRFGSAMADAYDRLADNAKTPEAKDMALDRKLGNTTAAFINAVDANPLAGLMDMMVMVTLVRQASEDAWFTALYGDDASKVVATLKVQEADIWHIATRYLTPSQLAELRESIDRWRAAHPEQRYVAMVRLIDFPEAKSTSGAGAKAPGSVFGLIFMDPFSSLDPAVREVARSREAAERMFFYMQRMPILLSWEAESVYRRMLAAPEIQRFLDETSKFTASTLRFADATQAVADSVKSFPQFMTEERERSVNQLTQKVAEQRDAAIRQTAEAVAAERDAAIRQLNEAVAVQRDAAIRQVADTAAAQGASIIAQATTQISGERTAAVEQLNASVQAQRQGLMLDLETTATRLIDRLFWVEMVVLLTAFALLLLGIAVYRIVGRGARQRRDSHRTAAPAERS